MGGMETLQPFLSGGGGALANQCLQCDSQGSSVFWMVAWGLRTGACLERERARGVREATMGSKALEARKNQQAARVFEVVR